MGKEQGISIGNFDSLCPLKKAGWSTFQRGGDHRIYLTYPNPDPLTLSGQRQSQANTALNSVCRSCRFKGNPNIEQAQPGKCIPGREFEENEYPLIVASLG